MTKSEIAECLRQLGLEVIAAGPAGRALIAYAPTIAKRKIIFRKSFLQGSPGAVLKWVAYADADEPEVWLAIPVTDLFDVQECAINFFDL